MIKLLLAGACLLMLSQICEGLPEDKPAVPTYRQMVMPRASQVYGGLSDFPAIKYTDQHGNVRYGRSGTWRPQGSINSGR